MKKEILYTAFKGKTNSSKVLLDNINSQDKLYLTNSFVTSVTELEQALKKKHYDLIISFGQAFLDLDTIQIETLAQIEDNVLKTNYEYLKLKKDLEKEYKVVISETASNYLCNNIYYHGLRIIKENNYKTNIIFIHIPKLENISNIVSLANIFNNLNLK